MNSLQSDDIYPNVDEYSDSKNLQKQNAELRQINNQMLKDLNSMKKQFEEATSIKEQMQKIHDTNVMLAEELRKARSEKEEYESRMKINIESLEKRRIEMEEEKREIEEKAQKTIEEARLSFLQEKKELTQSMTELDQKYKEICGVFKGQKEEINSMKKTNQALITAAQTYFVMPFKTIDQLMDHLSQSPETGSQSDSDNSSVKEKQMTKQLEDLQKQIAELKQKVKAERKARHSAEETLSQSQNKYEQTQAALAQEKVQRETIENQFNNFVRNRSALHQHETPHHENEVQLAQLNKALERQKERNRELEIQIEEQKANSISRSEFTNLQNVLDHKEQKIKTLQSTLISIKQQNTMLLAQIKESDKSKEQLRSKNQNLQEENMQCTSGIQQLKEENTKLSFENNSLNEQKESLENQLQLANQSIQKLKSTLTESQYQNEKCHKSLQLTEDALFKQKQELIDVAHARAQVITALQKQNTVMSNLENQLAQTTQELKESQRKVISLSSDLRQQEYLPKMEEIPETSWFCIDFPKSLCSKIVEEAKDHVSTPIKLRRILAIIAKFYNSNISTLEKNLEEKTQRDQETSIRMNHLFQSLSPMVKSCPSDYQTFISNPDTEKKLIDSISEMHDSNIDMKVSNIKITKQLKEIATKLNLEKLVGVDEIFNQFWDEYNNLVKQNEELKTNEKKLRKALRTTKLSYDNHKQQTQEIENDRLAVIKSLQNENQRLKNECFDVNDKYEATQSRLKEIERDHGINLNEKEDNELLISQYRNQIDHLKADFAHQMNEKDEMLRKANSKIDKLEIEKSQYKRTSEMMQNDKWRKDKQLASLVTKMEENNQDNEKSRNTQINEIKSQYEKILEELKQKNKTLKNLFETANNSLTEATDQNRRLTSDNTEFAAENQQLKSELQTLQEEKKREKQLNDAKIKAVGLSNETQRLLDVENAKSKYDEEKRNLYEFVAMTFHHLFDARQELSDETFKALIEKASIELQKYMRQDATIRRLLGIKPNDSPEEAISRLLLSMYQQS